jgi:hypothetical protein
MAKTSTQRVVLRRTDPDAPQSSLAATRIEALPGIAILDRSSASSLLVEGSIQAIRKAVAALPGWKTVTIRHYDIPDPRPRIRKPRYGDPG